MDHETMRQLLAGAIAVVGAFFFVGAAFPLGLLDNYHPWGFFQHVLGHLANGLKMAGGIFIMLAAGALAVGIYQAVWIAQNLIPKSFSF